ncbi:MAG: TonB-dependent receptor [Chryseolinea sp.]
MKTTLLLLFVCLTFSSHAQSNNPKKVTLTLSAISLERALAVLAAAYQTDVSYSDDIVPVDDIVSLSIQDETLANALDKLLRPYDLGYKVIKDRVVLKRSPIILTQTVRGSVRDQITGELLPGVSITIKSSNFDLGSSSDAQGKFKITSVPVGRISLIFSCVGFDSHTVDNLLLGTGKEMILDVKLSETIIAISEVVITANRNEASGVGAALPSSRSFTVEETKRYAGSLGDPARMVTAFAGVAGSGDESNALIVRGNSPRGLLWRIEGVEVPNPNHFTTEGASGGVVSALSANILDRSDFLTGAFPARYGNALSGVFDINLRNGNDEKREYSAQVGLLGIEASAEGPLARGKPSSFLMNYRYSTLSILDMLDYNLNEAGQYKNYQDLSLKLNCPIRSGTLSVFGIGAKSNSDKAIINLYDRNISDMGVVGINYKTIINESTSLQSSLSGSGTEIGRDNEISGSDSSLIKVEERYAKSYMRTSLSLTKRINSSFVLEAGATQSFLEYDFYLRNRDPENIFYKEIINFSEKGKTSITQGFLQARHHIAPRISLSYGAHYMRFALTNDQTFEPRMAVRWQPSDNSAWTISYGKHSRIENLQYYLARDHQIGGSEVQINKDLRFTRAHHVVLAYEQSILSDVMVKVETYYQKLYNAPVGFDPSALYSSINEDTGFITDTLVNKGTGRNYGIEISVEKKFTNNFYYMTNVSLYESKFTIAPEPERNTSYNGNYNIHLLGGREILLNRGRDRLGLNIKVTSAGGRRYVPIDEKSSIEKQKVVYERSNAFEERLPAYFRTDFQAVYRKNCPRYSLEWRLDIQNITNHRNAAYFYFDNDNEEVRLKKTIGFLPILSWRVDF